MRHIRVLLCLLLVLPLAGVFGCSGPSPARAQALLPQGFGADLLPDVDIQGYMYVNQEAHLSGSAPLAPGLPAGMGVDSASLWFGPSTGAMGATLDMRRESEAQALASLRNVGDSPVWALAIVQRVFLAAGSGAWSESLKGALFTQRMSLLAAKYPVIWGDFAYFPARPPARPVGGGFLRIDGALMGSIAAALKFPIASFTQPLQTAGISYVTYLLYSDLPVQLPDRIDSELLSKSGVRVLIAGHSGFPPILFGFGFDTFVQQAGLSKTTVRGADMYTYPAPAPGIEVVVGRKENLVYFAIAQTRELAEGLLLSALE